MLALIGLGLGKGDISIKAAEFLKKADNIMYEEYTANIQEGYIEEISKMSGKEPEKISRKDLEDNVKATVKKAKSAEVALLFPGDPLVATTHHIIMDEAAAQGIRTAVFHAPSIFTAAIGESGLDIYKFGPTATIPKFSRNYRPTSFIELIKRNYDNGQHTLVLFDVGEDTGSSMKTAEAVSILTEAMKLESVEFADTKAIMISDIGRKGQKIAYLDINSITRTHGHSNDSKTQMACMIIPSKMSFAEEHAVLRHAAR